MSTTELDISCILTDQNNPLLFSYPIVYKAIVDALNTKYRLHNHKHVPETIMSFLSTTNVHLIADNSINLDGPQEPIVTLLAVSVHNNQPLFRISSHYRTLPDLWIQRNSEFFYCSASYNVHVTGNHLWMEYEAGDECFSDDEAFENEDPSTYYEMKTHYLFHAEIVSANHVPKRMTRVSHKRKMECPIRISDWEIYSGKRELVKWNDHSGGYPLITTTDLRNYKHNLFFVNEHCLLFAEKYIYILNKEHPQHTTFDVFTEWNHPYALRVRCASITNFFKSYNILDIAFLLDNVDNDALNKSDKIISILYNVDDFRIDFIRIPPNNQKDRERSAEPPTKKRKIEHCHESLLFTLDLNAVLRRLYDTKSLFIHGYYVDVKNEWILIVVNTNDILCFDKDCNLIKRHKINDNVFDERYFGSYWSAKDYVLKIEQTLNNRDFLFVIHSATHSGLKDIVIVDGYNFSRIENARFESHLRWAHGLSNFGSNACNRTPCDLSNISNLEPFIY